jgi:hypothetical protein
MSFPMGNHWLENHGCTIVEVSHQESGMSVRYCYPGCPGPCLADAGGSRGAGGLVTPSEVEVARECVRRAPWAEGASPRAGRLEGLADLDAGRLEARLRGYFEAAGPQATQGELALARELLSRARNAENLERLQGGPGGASPEAA